MSDRTRETLCAIARLSPSERELLDLTHRILEAIHAGDLDTYRASCLPDLSCYETDVAPYRIDVLEFHLDLMAAQRERGSFGGLVRFDVLTPRVQLLGDCGIVTYTRLMTWQAEAGPFWRAFNETRVFVRVEGAWKMAHFHRSQAPA